MEKKVSLAVFFSSFLMALVLGFAPPLVFADMIQGEITEVKAETGSFNIARSDPESNAAEPESIKVSVAEGTVFEGLMGIQELRAGDEIWVDVVKDEDTVNWVAKKIILDKVNIREPKEHEAL